jgi:aminodeoxyfutalosine deaminase
MILRARVLLPISAPMIRDGAVRVSGKRIAEVGRWRDMRAQGPKRETLDLGDVVLMPGLVNAHCHLDYTHMAGQFSPPKTFTDWLKLITTTKGGWEFSEYAASWLDGARMLLRTGTTTVGDIEAVPQLLPEMWQATPLRVISFLELIGITGRRPARALVQEALDKGLKLRHPQCRVGLSPHAPYSTLPELLTLSAQVARKYRWPMCTHLAESELEFEMFARGRGEMYDWLLRSGRNMADCGLASPTRHLETCGFLGPHLLAAHVNYLGPRDAALLASRKVNVVHCPRSHSYFRHGPFPWQSLQRARVNICLGTDSLASVSKTRKEVVELSLFDEMRALAHREPSLSARRILRMSTISGAQALGLAGRVGELTAGAFADMIVLPLLDSGPDIHQAVLQYRGRVGGSMIGGKWAVPPVAEN